MDYHAKNRSEDGVLRMPADGSALKNIKEIGQFLNMNLVMLEFHWRLMVSIHLERFVLLTQFGIFFVINNNLPPYMSIKREHTLLAMIIPGIFLR